MSDFEALVETVATCLSGECGVADGQALMVAVSGGADSLFLLRALAHLRDRWPLVAAVFVDHGLRDVSEELSCAKQAASEHDVPLRVRRVVLPDGGNVQQNARRARYAAMREEVAEGDCLMCTGHTLSDQAETVLERLLRGAGLRGLSGIPYRRGRWVRPMLQISRQQVRAVVSGFAEDPSNNSDAYLRNRIRRHILPVLRRENASVERALAQVARAASAELELVDALSEAVTDAAPVTGVPPETAEALVRWRLRRQAPNSPPVRRRAVELLARRLVSGQSGRVSLGQGVAGESHHGVLRLTADHDGRSTLIAPGLGHYANRIVSMTLWSGARSAEGDQRPQHAEQELVRLPEGAVIWPITLRRWRLGDSAEFVRGWRLVDGAGKVWWCGDVKEPGSSHSVERGARSSTRRSEGTEVSNSLFIRLCFLSG